MMTFAEIKSKGETEAPDQRNYLHSEDRVAFGIFTHDGEK
jgi:hypothetical protein